MKTKLNENEKSVLSAVIQSAHCCSGGDFAIGSEIAEFIPRLRALQVAGFLSSLQKKGAITIDGPVAEVNSQITIHNNPDGTDYDPCDPCPAMID